MDTLGCIKVFVAVVDQGGFAAAGRALDLSPPVVTRMVSELEAKLGVRLLQRTTRRISLTEPGAAYLERVREVLLQLEEAEAQAIAHSTEAKGVLRLLAPPSFSSYLLAWHLPDFMRQYPEVSVDVSHGFADAADTGYDISILFASQPPDGDFVAHLLGRMKMVLCAAPAYLAARGQPRHPDELLSHRCLVVNALQTTRHWQLSQGELRQQLTPPAVLATPMVDPLLRAALAGLGIAGLPDFVAGAGLAAGELQRVLPDWELKGFDIYAAVPTRKHMPARTRAVLDFLRQRFHGGGPLFAAAAAAAAAAAPRTAP
ncbi:MAG: LysR family transcriptional regulator [Burkholderiaceae bacterium]